MGRAEIRHEVSERAAVGVVAWRCEPGGVGLGFHPASILCEERANGRRMVAEEWIGSVRTSVTPLVQDIGNTWCDWVMV